MDISAMLVLQHDVILSHRNGFHVAPKVRLILVRRLTFADSLTQVAPRPIWFSLFRSKSQQPSVPYDVSAARFGDAVYIYPALLT